MAGRELGEGGDFLMSDEREFLTGDALALAARAHVSQAAGKLALELGLAPEAGLPFVDAFRARVAAETASQLTAAAEIGGAIDHLREVMVKYGSAVLEVVSRSENLDELANAATDEEADVVISSDAPASSSEVSEPETVADEPQTIQLNKRARTYLQTIFGDISELNLQENDKLMIAKTINELRGEGSRTLSDLTMQMQLLLAGLKDAEIAEHVHKLPGSVATGFSMAMKRIKTQPGYTAENARNTLLAKLEAHRIYEDTIDDAPQLITEEDDEANEEHEVLPPQAWQLKENVQTGKLQGAIRLQLRKAKQDHMVELGEMRLQELINQVAVQGNTPKELQDAYEQFLSTGVPEFGNEQLRSYINDMPNLIAAILMAPADTSNVLPITTPTHHHRTSVGVTPAIMPRKQVVLPFVAPQKHPHLAEEIEITATQHNHETYEVPALVAAAYNESAMSSETWHKTAYSFITEQVPLKLGLSEDQAQGLWAAVHFSKGDDHKLRPPETKAALNALQLAMEEANENTWKYYPELQSCLRKLLNPFPPQSLGAIQRSLQAKDKTVSNQAAQRHVVAAIYELTKDRYGEATA